MDTIIHSNQLGERQIHCTVESNAIVVGTSHMTVTHTGTGVYDFAVLDPGIRDCHVQATAMTAKRMVQVVLDSNVAFQINTFDEDGTAADSDLIVQVTSFDSESET